MLLQRHHAEHGGIPCGADGHGIPGAQARGQRHQPVALDPCPLRQPAAVGLTHAPSVQHHLVAGAPVGVLALQHGTGKVDAGDQGEAAHHGGGTGEGQAVLVVEGRPLHRHGHIPGRQYLLGEALVAGAITRLVFLDQNTLEHLVSSH